VAKKLYKKKDTGPESEQQQVSNILTKIGRAEKVKKHWKDRFRVDLAYQYWEGIQRPSSVDQEEWITVNKIYSTLMAELPALYSQNPEYYVKVKKAFTADPMIIQALEAQAETRSAMLNYLRDELSLKAKMRLSIFDAHFQFGVAKCSYEVDLVDNPEANEPILGEGGEALFDRDDKPILQPEQLPTNQKYVVQRIHPDDFLVDEDAGPLSFNWAAHRIRRRLTDVKNDKKYKASARERLKATEISSEEKAREERKKGGEIGAGSGPMARKEEAPDIVVLWEVWYPDKRQYCVVSEGCQEEFLLDPQPYPDGIEEHPFVDLRFILRDDSWYPMPWVAPLLDPQKEFGLTRSKVLTHRKRFNRKYEVYLPAFDDPEQTMAKLENGDDGTVVGRNAPQPAVVPIQDAPLDMQVHTELAYLNQDFQELAVGANQRGAGTGVDSATEAGIIEKRAIIREGDKVGAVTDFAAEIGRKIDMLVQANLTDEFAVKVAGVQGMTWTMVKPQDYQNIYGEFTTSVVVGSHTPQLPEIERAQIVNWLSLILPNMAVAGMMPQTMKMVGKTFNIEERKLELIIQEFAQASQQINAGMVQPGGQSGSLPGVSESREQSAGPGAAAGINNIRGGMQ